MLFPSFVGILERSTGGASPCVFCLQQQLILSRGAKRRGAISEEISDLKRPDRIN